METKSTSEQIEAVLLYHGDNDLASNYDRAVVVTALARLFEKMFKEKCGDEIFRAYKTGFAEAQSRYANNATRNY